MHFTILHFTAMHSTHLYCATGRCIVFYALSCIQCSVLQYYGCLSHQSPISREKLVNSIDTEGQKEQICMEVIVCFSLITSSMSHRTHLGEKAEKIYFTRNFLHSILLAATCCVPKGLVPNFCSGHIL